MKGEKAVKGFEKLPDFLLFTLPVRDVKSPFGIFLGINFDSAWGIVISELIVKHLFLFRP